jgi:hypothetical protein
LKIRTRLTAEAVVDGVLGSGLAPLCLPDVPIRVQLQLIADPNSRKERMHIDLETDDVAAEVRRLETLSLWAAVGAH